MKSVLSAIPLHQLLVLAPPKKILKMLERIQRGFLWAGRTEANGGHCHVSRHRVTRPKCLGGLGVHDLERIGMALWTRWLWFSKTDERRAWAGLDLQFSAEEHAFFFASTHTIIRNGESTRFWGGRWINGCSVYKIAPLLHACIPKQRRKSRTVAEGLQAHLWARNIHGVLGVHEIGQYLLLWRLLKSVSLSLKPDKLVWKWNEAGTYTARSAYHASFHGSIASDDWKLI